jgi:hypothetical protein
MVWRWANLQIYTTIFDNYLRVLNILFVDFCQILMNVQHIITIVTIMLSASTQMDPSLVIVKTDILEMVNRVKVSQCLFDLLTIFYIWSLSIAFFSSSFNSMHDWCIIIQLLFIQIVKIQYANDCLEFFAAFVLSYAVRKV